MTSFRSPNHGMKLHSYVSNIPSGTNNDKETLSITDQEAKKILRLGIAKQDEVAPDGAADLAAGNDSAD